MFCYSDLLIGPFYKKYQYLQCPPIIVFHVRVKSNITFWNIAFPKPDLVSENQTVLTRIPKITALTQMTSAACASHN